MRLPWVLIELRDAPSAALATSSATIARQVALVLKDGQITGPDGNSNLLFNYTVQNSLFFVVRHRYHLGIMSSVPLLQFNGVFN
jgi:hypothetical protein